MESTRKVYVWRCRACGKELVSLYEKQLEAMAAQHLKRHRLLRPRNAPQ
jgi:hypothetical protein